MKLPPLRELVPFLIPFALIVIGAALMLLNGCAVTVTATGLPHRPVNSYTSWGQGHNPGRGGCPAETIPLYLDDDVFLLCLRGNTN